MSDTRNVFENCTWTASSGGVAVTGIDCTYTKVTRVPVVTLTLPDPSALTWLERADLRTQAADDYRAETGTSEDVGVDIVVDGEH